jgi:hypothetical protein
MEDLTMKAIYKRAIFFFIYLIIIINSISYAYSNQDNNTVSGLIYINDLYLLTQEQFEKVRDCREIKYVSNMMSLHPSELYTGVHAIERDRIIELAKAGKRLIIKVWFGSGGYYNWSYCSYPNIAMQQEVRDYLFSVIDNAIDRIGPEYIYGMHLLEEDGHFAVDIDEPGDWRKNKGAVRSGKEDGDVYNNFSNLRARYHGPSDWTPAVPNIAQYNSVFKAETGLDMNNVPQDDPVAYPILDRWMARRLWAGAHRAFLQHLKAKYPNIRRFVWGNIAQPWNGTDIGSLKDIVDGVISDPYQDVISIQHSLSGLKTLLPQAEHLVLLLGSPDISTKYMRAATAYLNGATAVGFFEKALNDEKLWDANVKIWKKLSIMPVIKDARPKVLIITGNTDNGYSTSKIMLPFFKFPAVLTDRDATNVDLSQYKMVVLHYCTSFRNDIALSKYNAKGYGPDDRKLKDWVASGGLLVITSPYRFPIDSKFFLAEERIAWTTGSSVAENFPVKFTCGARIAEKYGIKPTYTLLGGVSEISWGRNRNTLYDKLPIGGVAKYGDGKIVILPIYHRDSILLDPNTTEEFRALWKKEVANYIADVIRGVVRLYDSSGTLIQEIDSPGEPFNLEWKDKNRGISVKVIFEWYNQKISSEIIKSGEYIMGT